MPTPLPRSSNFEFLRIHDPLLVALGAQAERYFAEDPTTCLMKLRQFAEVLAQRAAANLGLYASTDQSQVDLIRALDSRGALTVEVRQVLHDLRRAGNVAAHEARGTHSQALHGLKLARVLAIWFHRTFGKERGFSPGPFIPPPDPAQESKTLAQELERLRSELAQATLGAEAARAAAAEEARQRLTAEERARRDAEEREVWQALAEEAEAKLKARLDAVQSQANAAPAQQLDLLLKRAQAAGAELDLDEADTRQLIDEQLRQAGWEADSQNLTFAAGARPQRGRNLAIAEWPTESGPADYVLFAGLDALAVVEAKRRRKDAAGAIQQAKRYSEGYQRQGEEVLPGGPWGKYLVPFLFATNGRPYLRQLELKSGIHFLDARRPTNHPRALAGWYAPAGLRELLQQDREASEAALRAEPTEYLGLRDYQIKAIQAVEAALEKGRRESLIAMATGTGKTRTFIGLVYRLVKTRRFRRVLFLVDRSALGEQAINAFKHARLESLQTFTDIFNVKGLEEVRPDPETKLHFATVQGMVKRILYSDDGERPSVDDYDCIVVDECHRGYTLDREMSDSELSFRSQDDYISTYRRVLDHFDAVKIGLTATPALHTTQIFGDPVYTYSYPEAVIDGWLVDHEPPIRINTELSEGGIRWAAGEAVPTYNTRTQQLDLIHMQDELSFDVESFNTRVVTENFNRVVCEELARQIDPAADGKTLIFCATDAHADIVVAALKKALDAQYGGVDDNAVMKITGSSDKPLQLIRRFKNEKQPSIAVTVDLLTTGIDVPPIVNVVFLRRVKSRILYEQMLGRGTRRCDDIGKEVFRIFDAVDLYGALEPFTSMKPVVVNPFFTFTKLVDELLDLKDAEAQQQVIDQLVVKLRRKRPVLEGRSAESLEAAAGMPVGEVLTFLRKKSPAEIAAWLSTHKQLGEVLDTATGPGPVVYVSDHVDKLRSVERGYGPGRVRPKDYLDEFGTFIRQNQNVLPALMVVCQRPRELTRQQLKELKLALDRAGYNETSLQTAWRDMTNQDIAASIIGFIRQRALGEALVPYSERVDRALGKVLEANTWTTPQRKWLERIAKQLKVETVMDKDALNRGQFEASGGFTHINKVFEGRLEQVLADLRDGLWQQGGKVTG
ncbi:type I restriction-modification system endonuclease [Corallococcus sp. M34]|uniref:type I restriction-modification system endonuclease n=1 Tax=Citreicoccus inhibens TaxID=2849499 RepID=UPI001C24FBA1|nr:type I restriction-modification system endonuclease [Citreicoccus inhibens]MBU8900842.1 type I restriction-modification system endonuclease [Citreicoccus inhibens]